MSTSRWISWPLTADLTVFASLISRIETIYCFKAADWGRGSHIKAMVRDCRRILIKKNSGKFLGRCQQSKCISSKFLEPRVKLLLTVSLWLGFINLPWGISDLPLSYTLAAPTLIVNCTDNFTATTEYFNQLKNMTDKIQSMRDGFVSSIRATVHEVAFLEPSLQLNMLYESVSLTDNFIWLFIQYGDLWAEIKEECTPSFKPMSYYVSTVRNFSHEWIHVPYYPPFHR